MGSGASATDDNGVARPDDLQDVLQKVFEAYDSDGDHVVTATEFVEAEEIVALAQGEQVDRSEIMSTYFELSLGGAIGFETFMPWITDKLSESASNQSGILRSAEERIQYLWCGRNGPLSQSNLERLGKAFSFQAYIGGAEYRGITLKQLQYVFHTVEQQCKYWRDLSPPDQSSTSGQQLKIKDLNLYHVDAWLIRPSTKLHNCSMIEMLCGEPQPPDCFVSHWWGDPIACFLQCVSSHSTLRQLASNNNYWVCAYANCQHALQDDISDDPAQTSFVRALKHTKFKVLLVLDQKREHSGPATPFLRIWCALEEILCLKQPDSLLDVAISDISGQAKVLTTGLTQQEELLENVVAGSGFRSKIEREQSFSLDIVEAGLGFDVTKAKSSVLADSVHILNFLAGETNLNRKPHTTHHKYDENNARLRSYFARSFMRRALVGDSFEKETNIFHQMIAALRADKWESALTIDLRGTRIDDLGLSVLQLPPKLEVAHLLLAHCKNVTDVGVLFFSCNLPDSLTSLSLGSLDGTQVSLKTRALCTDLDNIKKLACLLIVVIRDVDAAPNSSDALEDEIGEDPKRAYKAQTNEGLCVMVSSDSDLRELLEFLAQSKLSEEEGRYGKVVCQVRRSDNNDLMPGLYIRSGSLQLKYDLENADE